MSSQIITKLQLRDFLILKTIVLHIINSNQLMCCIRYLSLESMCIDHQTALTIDSTNQYHHTM